ncbi:MAG: glutamine synthetase beta-grasp domain-containing protein [Fimbriimonadales bacterium]
MGHYLKYLEQEKRIKAVTVCFTDLEGRFHMLDYDKKFLLKSHDNLTFDGSSIRGFSVVSESDLRLAIDWGSFRWLPSDVFGPGKVIVFGLIKDREGNPYGSDFRGLLKQYAAEQFAKKGYEFNIAVECEGFLFEGLNAEQKFTSSEGFKLVSSGGYYHSLPNDPLRRFIDRLAEAQRALGFENEKDHPEVAPSQFELNYMYTDALLAADQVQLYKLTARQIAANMGLTASFLPKPISGINGSGMHTNMSITQKGTNIFYDKKGEDGLSKIAWDFVDRLLNSANDICLILNPSVNAYRRLDPHYEAPNQIKSSAVDRTSMIRIPLGNAKSARVESHGRSGREPVHDLLLAHPDRHGGTMTEKITDGNPPHPNPVPARQHLRRHPAHEAERLRDRALGRDEQGEVHRPQGCRRRALRQGVGHPGQDRRGHLPPRGDQPVSLGQVLEPTASPALVAGQGWLKTGKICHNSRMLPQGALPCLPEVFRWPRLRPLSPKNCLPEPTPIGSSWRSSPSSTP